MPEALSSDRRVAAGPAPSSYDASPNGDPAEPSASPAPAPSAIAVASQSPPRPASARRADFRSLASVAIRAARGKRVVGFDVFDTLLRRRIEPETVKDLTAREFARRMTASGSAESWPALREQRRRLEIDLYEKSRWRGGDAEFELREMMRFWVTECGAGNDAPQLADALVAYEIAAERRATLPAPGIVGVLESLRALGYPMVFVSDIYLSGDDVWSLLREHELQRFFQRGYVSSDFRRTKRSGRLFQVVLTAEGLRPDELLFIGDNRHVDVDPPRRLGIDVVHVCDRREQRRRARVRLLDDLAREAQAPAGAHWRGVRALECVDADVAATGDASCPHHALGRTLGPVFAAFVMSVVDTARDLGLRRLFFLSREGAMFLRCYRRWVRARNISDAPPAAYLGASRAATFLPSMSGLTWAEIERVWTQYPNQSIRCLLRNLSLDGPDFERLAVECGFADLDRPIIDPLADVPLRTFLAHAEVQRGFRLRRDAARAALLDYLAHKGMFEAAAVGLVDVGWKGSMQDNLVRVLRTAPRHPLVHGLYLALGPLQTPDSDDSRKHGFLADSRGGDWTAEVILKNGPVFEMFASAPHGPVVGYGQRRGRAGPLLQPDAPAEARFESLARRVRRGVFGWIGAWERLAPLLGVSADELRAAAIDRLRRYVLYPTTAEARAFLQYSHRESFGVHGVSTYRFRGSWREMLLGNPFGLHHRVLATLRRQFWPEAVLRRARLPLANFAYDLLETRLAGRRTPDATLGGDPRPLGRGSVRGRRRAGSAVPSVAIVIPCFNHGRFVRVALDSARAQTQAGIECVVVDDGSTDADTVAVLRQLADEGVRVLCQPNGGLSAARNAGVRATQADFFVPLDADDFLHPEFVERLIEPMQRERGLGYCYSHVQLVGSDPGTWFCPPFDERTLVYQNLSTATALVRRAAFDAVGGYRAEMSAGYEDWDFWLALTCAGFRGRCVPERLFYYRRHAPGVSMLSRVGSRHADMLLRMIARYRRLYQRELLPGRADASEEDLLTELLARVDLHALEHARTWRLVRPLRYVGLGRLLLGESRANGSAPPTARERLAALRASPAQRLIRAAKQTRLYRAYARRKYGPDTEYAR
jgi:FMN phosphatase YigB (HAD superfamily)/GT2 family glycosyltransferase